jgi:hypothetical protein
MLERLADHFLTTRDAVPLAVGEPTATRDAMLKRRDGRTVHALPDERRYSTPALLWTEQTCSNERWRAVTLMPAWLRRLRPSARSRRTAPRPVARLFLVE